MSLPKLVIVSNHCVSQSDANGRSLLNLLGKFDSSRLFQIYSANEDLSLKYCQAYWHLTNRNALRGVFGLGKQADYLPTYTATDPAAPASAGRKSAMTMLLRDLTYRCSWGMARALRQWAREVKPDAVILQLGDSAHLIRVAEIVADCCKIPIITYNTEDYYFKHYDYMKGKPKSNLLFACFQKHFRRAVRKLFKKHKTVLCNCEGLKARLDEEFGVRCEVLYTASELSLKQEGCACEDGLISYCGNLGVGRHTSLIEIGNALQRMDPRLKLEVYGRAPTEAIRAELTACEGIAYHGVVSYAEVQRILNESRLLIHAEGFEPYTVMDTRYAFSTKLADYCSSGIPMLIYAPPGGEGMKYIRSNDLGFTATNREELAEALKTALSDREAGKRVVERSLAAARENHDIKKNGVRVSEIILHAIK